MRVKVHTAALTLQDVQNLVRDSGPSEYVPAIRNWLLAGPKFSEFEGFSRFLEQTGAGAKIRAEVPCERWAVVGGYTPRPVAAALRVALLAHGSYGVIHEADYGAFDIELLSDDSATLGFRPEHVLLCTGHHHVPGVPSSGAPEETVMQAQQAALEYLQIRWRRIREKTGAVLHQHAFCLPAIAVTGRLEDKYSWGKRRFFRGLNDQLWSRDGRDIHVVPVDDLQERVGLETFWSSRWYHIGKLPFNPERLRDYAILLYAHIAAFRGTARKCLVVDLDDTLWGGVIGDDGIDGIVFGNGSAEGEEFLEVCDYIGDLGRAGVILGVVSKNDETIARSVFRDHKQMPLKLSDFAIFKTNWQPKSVSLREAVKELNIGMDAVVYLDDNPAECEEVSRAYPEVIVLQVAQGSNGLAQSIDSLRLFDRQSFTAEDASRAASYASMQLLRLGCESRSDLSSFLSSLDMGSAFEVVTSAQIPRAAQLFAKTNQFNLTQTKFTEQDLTEMAGNGVATCFVATLDDKFAKHGIVSALTIRRAQDSVAEIVNWVMSCRVFNRSLEEFMLLRLKERLAVEGYSSIAARLIETDKNRHVHNLFGRLGFEKLDSDGSGAAYRFDLSNGAPWQTYIHEQ